MSEHSTKCRKTMYQDKYPSPINTDGLIVPAKRTINLTFGIPRFFYVESWYVAESRSAEFGKS